MKKFLSIFILSLAMLAGCLSSSNLVPAKSTISNSTAQAVHTIEQAKPKEAIQAVINNASHILIVSGVLAVIAGAALIYFGRIILGVEFILGGIIVPIAAIWLLHYYVWVILGTIAVLVVTHWSIIRPYVLPLFEKVETIVEAKETK